MGSKIALSAHHILPTRLPSLLSRQLPFILCYSRVCPWTEVRGRRVCRKLRAEKVCDHSIHIHTLAITEDAEKSRM